MRACVRACLRAHRVGACRLRLQEQQAAGIADAVEQPRAGLFQGVLRRHVRLEMDASTQHRHECLHKARREGVERLGEARAMQVLSESGPYVRGYWDCLYFRKL